MSLPSGSEARRRQVVLIVEDDPCTADLMALLAREEGWYPVLASNGSDAIARAREVLPSTVVLDLMLPGESGIEVGQRLAALFAPAPPILVASADRRALSEFAQAVGAFATLEKPFELDELIELVGRGMQQAAAHPPQYRK